MDPLERNDQGCLVTLELERDALRSFRVYPTIIQDRQARRACRKEARAIAAKLQRLSARFKTALAWDEEDGALVWIARGANEVL